MLKHLAENARVSDSAISSRIGITTQAVGKIRRKLEDNSVIKGYNVELDPEAIGLKVVSLVWIKLPFDVFENEMQTLQETNGNPHLIGCYQLLHGETNLFVHFAFKSLREAEAHFEGFRKRYPTSRAINMQKSSWDVVCKNSMRDIYMHILDECENGNGPNGIAGRRDEKEQAVKTKNDKTAA